MRCTPAGITPSAALPYTAQEIAARLGISMAVYQKERLGARHIAAVRAAGISHIKLTMIPQRFDLHDRAQVSEVLRECRRQKVTIVSVHGTCNVSIMTRTMKNAAPQPHLNFNKHPKRSAPYVTRNARKTSIHPTPRLPRGGLRGRDGAVALGCYPTTARESGFLP